MADSRSILLLFAIRHSLDGAEEQNRTADTAVFSRVLYQLSYLGAGDWYCMRTRFFVKLENEHAASDPR